MGDLPDWETQVRLTSDAVILDTTLIAFGGQTALLDVSAYNSIVISTPPVLWLAPEQLRVFWYDDAGNLMTYDALGSPVIGGSSQLPDLIIPVRGQKILIQNTGNDPQHIIVLGSGRNVQGLFGVGYRDAFTVGTGTITGVVNTSYPMGGAALGSQGWHQFSALSTNAALMGNVVLFALTDGLGNADVILAGAGEFVASPGRATVSKQVILPAGPCGLRYDCRQAGTGAITCSLVALGH